METPARLDLLKTPLLGAFLRWRHSRSALQLVSLLVAALVVYDGLTGPQLAPKNLAGVVPWVQWRGLIVLALLLVGNLFCMACPFMLPRQLAKKLLPARLSWPGRLPAKLFAVPLLILFFWSYEAFSLWSSPWLSAWLALAYFACAFLVDGLFKGAAFCKHLCPIGQFHFVNSVASPLEVGVRSPGRCLACTSKACIKGRRDDAGRALRGCELWLFQQRKTGNLDCTFCLDCAKACTEDNVGILGRKPVSELWRDRSRAPATDFARRPDLAAMAVVLVAAAFMNAFGMVAPVYGVERWIAGSLGTESRLLVLAVLFGFGLVVVPALLVSIAGWIGRYLAGSRRPVIQVASYYSFALVPLGFGMWLSHYSFHFLTGALTVLPVVQSLLSDLGLPRIGSPQWGLGPVVPFSWLMPVELLFLEGGLLA